MAKVIIFILSALVSLSPLFCGPGSKEGIKSEEVLLQSGGAHIGLSFEHYKIQNGWTPLVLSIGEFNCFLWMDETGGVSELPETGAHYVEPVCFIDVSAQSLGKEADALYFDVYEQNNVRTRWKLSTGKTPGIVTKILFREKNGVDLCLGTIRLQLRHIAWDFKEFSPGLYYVQLHGAMMSSGQPFIYEKAGGRIYSSREWDNQAAKPEPPLPRLLIPRKGQP